jgi:penicillin-insensitive murein endopeptidase
MAILFRAGLFATALLASASAFAEPIEKKPAKQIFGALTQPLPMEARAIGGYARGCLAGARMLAVNGPAWQAMRLSRNRNWGHPALVAYVEQLAQDAKDKDGWPGLLVGDLAQPWGGPMLTGHASHQIGLDADIWLKPMPERTLSKQERESISAISMLGPDKLSVDPKVWTPGHVALLKRAVSYPDVARVFVHPAIKKALCDAAGNDRGWLSKIRPWWGHHYHFHVRLKCPRGSTGCVDQPPAGDDDGCGAELDSWFRKLTAPPPPKPVKPVKPKPPLTLADLPKECTTIVQLARGESPKVEAPTGNSAALAEPDEENPPND